MQRTGPESLPKRRVEALHLAMAEVNEALRGLSNPPACWARMSPAQRRRYLLGTLGVLENTADSLLQTLDG